MCKANESNIIIYLNTIYFMSYYDIYICLWHAIILDIFYYTNYNNASSLMLSPYRSTWSY